MRTGRRGPGSERDHGNAMFGTIGWLFADLMLALALAFIVATTVLEPGNAEVRDDSPTTTAPPTTVPPTTSPPLPPPPPEPVLELRPVEITMRIDPGSLLAGDGAALQALRNRVRSDPRIAGRRAGLVLTFGGTNGGAAPELGLSIARRVNTVLSGLGAEGFVFRGTVYRPFISYDTDAELTIDIYLFKV